MSQIIRQTAAPDGDVILAIADFARENFRKVDVDVEHPHSVAVRKKVLWQNQEALFEAQNGVLTATGNCQDSDRVVMRVLENIANLLEDHGWNEATAHVKSLQKKPHIRNQVLAELVEGERVLAATTGFKDKKPTTIAATQRRIIIFYADLFGTDSSTQTIGLDKVAGVSETSSLGLGGLRISTSNDEITVEKVSRDELKDFVSTVRRAISQPQQAPEPTASHQSQSGGAAELAKLAELHAAGVLTDDEFAAAKARALGL